MIKSLFIICLITITITGYGQEFPDRHNTTLGSSWMSCNTSPNPNSIRGNSHWIMYDFNSYYALSRSKFWNVNAYGELNNGMKDIRIDYSIDGTNWNEFGRFKLNQASGLSTYEGETGPDFGGLVTRYLLITSISNHGGTCHGLSEFKVDSSPATISDVANLSEAFGLEVYPNPFSEKAKIMLIDSPTEDAYYQITDYTGKVLRTEEIVSSEFYISADNLTPAAYTITVFSNKGKVTKPLIVIK